MPMFDAPLHCALPHVPANEETGIGGVKRKYTEYHNQNREDYTSNVVHTEILSEEAQAKRHCREMSPDAEGDNGIVLHHNHLPHFLAASVPTPVAQDGDSEVYGCLKDVAGSMASTVCSLRTGNPSLHSIIPNPPPAPLDSQREQAESVYWMDMDGETYCPLVADVDMEQLIITPTSPLPSTPLRTVHTPSGTVAAPPQWPL